MTIESAYFSKNLMNVRNSIMKAPNLSGDMLRIGLLILISTVGRYLLAAQVRWISIPDSAWYASSAQSFYSDNKFLIGGVFNKHSMPLYSIFLAPTYFFGDMETTFRVIKLLNALAMSSAAIPIFLLAKRYIPREESFVVAVLSLLIGAMTFTSMVMAESLHYPLAAWIIYFVCRTRSVTGTGTRVVLGFLFGMALLNKMSSLALFACFGLTVFILPWVYPGEHRLLERLRLSVRSIFRERYVFLTVFLILGAYISFRSAETTGRGSIPYGTVWARYGAALTAIDVQRLLKWFIAYVGQLNISTGMFLFGPAVFQITKWCVSRDESKKFMGLFSATLFVGVVGLAAFQSGYSWDRLTERHFFVLSPLVFFFFFAWFTEGEVRRSSKLFTVIVFSVVIATAIALLTPSWTALYGGDSSAIDSLHWIKGFAAGYGLREVWVQAGAVCLSALPCSMFFWSPAKRILPLSGLLAAIYLVAISVVPYQLGAKSSVETRRRDEPIIRYLGDVITSPSNIVFLMVPRALALSHIIWNRDISNRIFWQARPDLANPSGFNFRDFERLHLLVNQDYPTYFVSPFFSFDGETKVGEIAGIMVYRVDSVRRELPNDVFRVDFGESSARVALQRGWSGDEGPNEDSGFPTFVWGVGADSEIEVFLQNTQERVLELRILPFPKGQAVIVNVNGKDIESIETKPGWNEYRICIPGAQIKKGTNRLLFKYRYARAPSETGSKDERKLAAAFDWVRVGYDSVCGM